MQARVLLAHELKLWQVSGIFKRLRKMNERRKIAQNVRSDQESALQSISAGKFLPFNQIGQLEKELPGSGFLPVFLQHLN